MSRICGRSNPCGSRATRSRDKPTEILGAFEVHTYLLVILFAFASSLLAQRTVKEITKPTTVEDDAKPNNDKVPEVYSMSGQLQRVVVLRFKYQSDLLAGIEKAVK